MHGRRVFWRARAVMSARRCRSASRAPAPSPPKGARQRATTAEVSPPGRRSAGPAHLVRDIPSPRVSGSRPRVDLRPSRDSPMMQNGRDQRSCTRRSERGPASHRERVPVLKAAGLRLPSRATSGPDGTTGVASPGSVPGLRDHARVRNARQEPGRRSGCTAAGGRWRVTRPMIAPHPLPWVPRRSPAGHPKGRTDDGATLAVHCTGTPTG